MPNIESDIFKDHRIAEIHGIKDVGIISDKKRLQFLMDRLADRLGLTIVKRMIYQFQPIGLSGVYVVSESHLAIHTWPEHKYAHIDAFTCSPDTSMSKLRSVLVHELPAEKYTIRKIKYD